MVHISLKDIGKIIHKATGGDDAVLAEIEKQEEIEKQKRLNSLSLYAKDFQMFREFCKCGIGSAIAFVIEHAI